MFMVCHWLHSVRGLTPADDSSMLPTPPDIGLIAELFAFETTSYRNGNRVYHRLKNNFPSNKCIGIIILFIDCKIVCVAALLLFHLWDVYVEVHKNIIRGVIVFDRYLIKLQSFGMDEQDQSLRGDDPDSFRSLIAIFGSLPFGFSD
jgi:hypothetical protein